MLNYDKLKSKAISINSDIQASRRKLRENEDKLKSKEKKIEKLNFNIEIQEKATELLKELIDEMSKEHIERVEDMLTYGLQTIFYDRNYAIKIKIEDKRNYKVADFYLLEEREGYVRETEFEDSIGGGVRVVVGFILQVFYIQYFNLKRIIFLDEAFSELSESYIDGLIEFINQLSEKKGFRFVLISHDSRINPYADKLYRVENGVVELMKGKEVDNGDNKEITERFSGS